MQSQRNHRTTVRLYMVRWTKYAKSLMNVILNV